MRRSVVGNYSSGFYLHLARQGTRLIALRSAGFNNVDLIAARESGLTVVRVPAYSPYAVAEHTMGLILTLNRKIHRAYARVREGNKEGYRVFGEHIDGALKVAIKP